MSHAISMNKTKHFHVYKRKEEDKVEEEKMNDENNK